MITETLNGRTLAEYTWGYLDKVIEVKCNGKVTRFDYDAQGMPVGKQLSTCRQAWPDGTYERWVWDGMALIARGDEYSINESPITGGLPIVSKTKEGVLYHQYDPLGATLASYTADGKLAATYKATAFGKGELQNSPAARFTGKPYDADLGAYVFPFRNYKPELARWMSADPSGFPDGPNNHFYAPVPTMEVDPWGLHYVTIHADRSGDSLAQFSEKAFGYGWTSLQDDTGETTDTYGYYPSGLGNQDSYLRESSDASFQFDVSETQYDLINDIAEARMGQEEGGNHNTMRFVITVLIGLKKYWKLSA